MPSRSLSASAAVVTAFVLVAGAVTLLPGAAPTASAEGLVPYGSCGELLEQYRSELERTATSYGVGGGSSGWGRDLGRSTADGVALQAGAPQPAAAEGTATSRDAVGSGPTGTNLQEHGVDEPDVAKTSGDLLLALAQNRLQVVRTGAQPTLLSSTPLGREAWGAELLVDGDRVLVLAPQGNAWGHPAASTRPWGPPVGGTVSAMLFDLADPTEPRLLEQMQLDGRYLSARLSDGAVRLITSSFPSVEGVQPDAPHGRAEEQAALAENRQIARSVGLVDVLPHLERRSPNGEALSSGQAVDCEQVRHAASPVGAGTLLVTTLDLDRGLEPQDRTAVTTDGDIVYASADRLYVATSRWGTAVPAPDSDLSTDTATVPVQPEVTTELHAFDTSTPDRTSYAGSGSVPGYVLGRWALSSYDGHLRVATTSAAPWGGPGPQSSSSVAVLEERADGLVQVGRVNDLGIGERIYAVRYFGELATVVTFRQTDPLYVLDLSDPKAPKLEGELKIPGFSTYLHPVGDDLLLGVGQDADSLGRVSGPQVSLFDLSDRSKPTQVDRLSLGQGWTIAGEESRAFGYDPSRRIAMLPFGSYDGHDGGHSSALGVRVEGRKLVEVGRMAVAGAQAERVLHDDARLYAVTQSGVVAGALDGFARTGAVAFGR